LTNILRRKHATHTVGTVGTFFFLLICLVISLIATRLNS